MPHDTDPSTPLRIVPLSPADHAAWLPLAQGYKAFYETPTTDSEYSQAWERMMTRGMAHGLAAWSDGRMVGIAHYLFHASTWADKVCYLQDLFVDPAMRGQGAARALIAATAEAARAAGATRYYWMTQAHNETARRLYDKVAKYNGFIRYDHPL